jgi:TfoX/Sxy family transcriptional regulator of competence genes
MKKGVSVVSTDIGFIEFICEQIDGVGAVRYKKMFGEYMVYVNDKPMLLVCDNTVFVKMLPELNEAMRDAGRGFPYEGAKEHYLLDIDDSEFSKEIIGILEPIIPIPKPKKKKNA